MRDTLDYLRSYSNIRVTNERGHVFNLGSTSYSQIVKITIFRPSSNLPKDCRRIRHHVSRSAGFIHIVNAYDYLEIARTLRVPQDVIQYFEYREKVLTTFGKKCYDMPEAAIVGHFIGGSLNEPPTVQSATHLRRLIQDAEKWDLAPFLRRLHDHLPVPETSNEYYAIRIEFAKLPRSGWREMKERILLCIEKVQKNEFALPYRISYPQTDCGFVFVPVISEISGRSDWPAIQSTAIKNFTQLHKYDQRLSKCIGVQVARDGDHFDIVWCFISSEWAYDLELRRAIEENFPFRPVRGAELPRYLFNDE